MSINLGLDRSGNNNHWTVNNMTLAADQMLDTPTNNFATLNPLWMPSVPTAYATGTLSQGNLHLHQTQGGGYWRNLPATISSSNLDTYFEVLWTEKESGDALFSVWAGGEIANSAEGQGTFVKYEQDGDAVGYPGRGELFSGTAMAQGDIIGCAIDDTNVKFYLNNSLQTTLSHGVSGEDIFGGVMVYENNPGGDCQATVNFGQDSSFAGNKTAQGNQDANGIGDFYYTPPAGYLALCTSNLPAVAVTPSEHYNTVEWTGNDSTNARTGIGFQPDYVWIKETTTAAIASHCSFDVLRGVNNALGTDDHGGQVESQSDLLTAFGADGFSLGANAGGKSVNRSSDTYVAWNWKAGGSGSANTDGNMAETVTVSANTDAGFSIVIYTGDGAAATVGHGLSKAPDMIVIKGYAVDNNEHWRVYHSSNTSAPETDYLVQDEVDATADSAAVWNDTAPTATVFSLGDADAVNEDDEPFVAYCWHSVDGYSKFGTYEGNALTDGTFVYTGFSPAWVMVKRTSSTSTYTSWAIYDSERKTLNSDTGLDSNPLYANKTAGEGERGNNTTDIATTRMAVDFLSNGFKFRDIADEVNATSTHIYAAFAETPFKYSNAQ